jgi:alkanesulfonate monooxygenase SsuD/methylene tetrahydromethanopterin reductase-like flavin-dependent oxidoreductase (luciferase family)
MRSTLPESLTVDAVRFLQDGAAPRADHAGHANRNRAAGRGAGHGHDADRPLGAEAEAAGFESVGVIDRLVYDNLDPLTALSAAASCTNRVELMSTVVNVCWRNNAVLLAKQLSSVVRLSGGRLTAGLGMGGWPADYDAGGIALAGRGS